MKFFKSTIILVTLFSCTLLLAQEATKSFEKIESGYSSLDNIDQDNNVIKFAEDFVQPIMRGEAYDISIGEIQLVTEYQRNNPIKCVFDSKETRDRNGCHDRVSFIEFFGRDRFDQVSDTKTVYPYSYIMKDYYIDKNNSIIIPFNISLKKEFQKKFLDFLDSQTAGYAEESYRKVPPTWTGNGGRSDYIKCNYNHLFCNNSLAELNLPPQDRRTTNNLRQSEMFVVKFIDRKKKQVSFYNLKNYRTSLEITKHKFLTNICEVMLNGAHSRFFSKDYIFQPHVQFNDLAIIFLDENNNEIERRIINTNDSSEHLRMNDQPSVRIDGIAEPNDYIFVYDYEKKSITGRELDYLGYRPSIGHLMMGFAGNSVYHFTNGYGCPQIGLSAEKPALNFISNFEFNFIAEMDANLLTEIRNIKINYVPGNTSNQIQRHPR